MWAKEMGQAYSAGLSDAKARHPSREKMFTFTACYLQGYRHGKS